MRAMSKAPRLKQLKPRLPMADTSIGTPIAKPNRQATREYHTGSKAWRRLRLQILARDGLTCEVCGFVSDQNEVDHRDGDAWNNDHANLRTLCKSCHSKHGAKGASKPHEPRYTIA
jgi:5-methylcytosine-specific restriction enzyme A